MTPSRLVELAVFAPIGAAIVARERLPEYVAVGREQVEQRVTVARFIGQMVVQQGRRELEKRRATPAPVSATPPEPPEPPDRPRSHVIAPETPPAAEMPIDQYESLAAGQVVARLAALDPEGLAAVETFEAANRNRRTVLNRIAQLRDRP
ncbi:hypothetical protein BH23ACT3_BH23ACT3_12270 [soil metagenome]